MSTGEARKLERSLRTIARRGYRASHRHTRRDRTRGRRVSPAIPRAETLGHILAQIPRRLARLEPEPAATRCRQRSQRSAVALCITARTRAEALDSGIVLAELQ